MSLPPINIDTEQILGFKSYWDNELAIIEKDLIVLTRDTDEFKRGNGVDKYIDLPTKLKVSDMSIILSKLSFINTNLQIDNIDKIAKLKNTNKITRSVLEDKLFKDIYQELNDNSIYAPTYINGPSKVDINTTIKLTLESFNSFNKFHCKDDFISEWIISTDLQNIITSPDNTLEYKVSNNTNDIGTSITIFGRLIDKLGNKSKTVNHMIEITSSNLSGYVKSTEVIAVIDAPLIISYLWDNNNHLNNNAYYLSVNYDDPNNDKILSLICDNVNVSITRSNYSLHSFKIVYPDFTQVTDVNFTLSLVDIYGYQDIKLISKTVNII